MKTDQKRSEIAIAKEKVIEEIETIRRVRNGRPRLPPFEEFEFFYEGPDVRITYIETDRSVLYPQDCNMAAAFLKDWNAGQYGASPYRRGETISQKICAWWTSRKSVND